MPASDSDSACFRQIHPLARKGIALFNLGEFYEAHELLEDAWREEPGEIRELYRGILQIAVMYFHITQGNYQGAVKMHGRCQKWLTRWPHICQGVNVRTLLVDAQMVLNEIKRLGPEHITAFDKSLFRPIQFQQSEYFCDRCGHEMFEHNCKITCPNCGNRFDCSDLNIYFD
ncbi:MAG: hypothetical protein Kow002_11620 [Anaerolineales bacterium]